MMATSPADVLPVTAAPLLEEALTHWCTWRRDMPTFSATLTPLSPFLSIPPWRHQGFLLFTGAPLR